MMKEILRGTRAAWWPWQATPLTVANVTWGHASIIQDVREVLKYTSTYLPENIESYPK